LANRHEALFVRLPVETAQRLDRAAVALGVRKKHLVAGLLGRYVDPDSASSLKALTSLTLAGADVRGGRPSDEPSRAADRPVRGVYSFQPYEASPEGPTLEVLNVEQAAHLLQIEAALVVELAESGKLPGRKLGTAWRFSRAALVEWLAQPEVR
jgi:excisionase family DNA binding protein